MVKNSIIDEISTYDSDMLDRYMQMLNFQIEEQEELNRQLKREDYQDYTGTNSKGLRTSCTGDCKVKGGVRGALYVTTNGSKRQALQNDTFELYPGESLEFGMNDSYPLYPTNVGGIRLFWTCLNCDSSFKERPVVTTTISADAEIPTYFSNKDKIITNNKFLKAS